MNGGQTLLLYSQAGPENRIYVLSANMYMALRLYNTLSRKKEAFVPLTTGQVRMYDCGPTVYDYAHIGNFRSYVFADLLRRFLEFSGFRVRQVMNITDVDDKTIKGSRKEGLPLHQFTRKYADAFFEDIAALTIKKADAYPKATDHIREMADHIMALLKKGMAYKGDDGIYFAINKFRNYGSLAHLDLSGLRSGARVRTDEYDKEQANDFALWKFWDKDDGDVFWETALGKGRPGWHIECSVMSMKHLGPTLDIHTGGVDLIFPHHQNEIAQSEALTGRPFVRYWLHNDHLIVGGRKMSKSLGNFYTLRDLLAKGYRAKAIRYFLLSAHYRTKLNLTGEALQAAESAVKRIEEFVAHLKTAKNVQKPDKTVSRLMTKTRKAVETALDDDLNMPLALAHLFDFIKEINTRMQDNRLGRKDAEQAYRLMLDVDRVLGLQLAELGEIWHERKDAKGEIKKLIDQREQLRKEKKFRDADKLREKLQSMGIILEDTPDGVKWRKR